jgi:hypothetical protein
MLVRSKSTKINHNEAKESYFIAMFLRIIPVI